MAGYRTLGRRLQQVQALSDVPDLTGRVALVTGSTDGVGRALAEQLARAGATTILTARDAAKGERAREAIGTATGRDDVGLVGLDLASLASVRACAAEVLGWWDRLDLIVCNAGVMSADGLRTTTVDGFETVIGVNHLGHALLISLLAERVTASAPSRIVLVASEAHRRAKGGLDFDDLMMTHDYRGGVAYGRSKLANILYTRELARRLAASGVTVNAAHPGGVDTPMMRAQMSGPILHGVYLALRRTYLISPQDAAAGLLRVAVDPALASSTGEYYEVGSRKRPKPMAEDDNAARRLWHVTADLIGCPATP